MHFRALDFYRFVAAMGVVLFHYSHKVDGPEFQSLRYMVDFFFVLSGFVIMQSASDIGRSDVLPFLLKRLGRIWPLHLLTLGLFVLYAVAQIVFVGRTSDHYDWSSLPQQLLMMHAWGTTDAATWNGPSWSISAEWFVYLLFPLFLALYRRWNVSVLLALSASVWVALTVNDYLDPGRPWTWATHDWGAVRAVPSFILGMALNRLPAIRVSWLVVGLAFSAVVASLALNLPGPAYVPIFGVLIYLTACAGSPDWMRTRLIGELGNLSYGVYMFHVLVLLVSFNAFGRWVPHVPLAAGAAIASLGVSWIVFHHFEKPCRDAVKDWLKGRRALLPAE